MLEVGSGGSTSWLAARSRQVDSIESVPDWFERVSIETAGIPNIRLELLDEPEHAVTATISTAKASVSCAFGKRPSGLIWLTAG